MYNRSEGGEATVFKMALTRKRLKIDTPVESALFNADVISMLAALMGAEDLCQLSLTCKALGGRRPSHGGLSLVEEAARRQIDAASDVEKAALPKFEGESWVELYRHLLMLRSELTFDQLIGNYIEHCDGDASTVRGFGNGWVAAICSKHIMRAGKHFVTFSKSGVGGYIGLIRPIQGWDERGLVYFGPGLDGHLDALLQERTACWGESTVHNVIFWEDTGIAYSSDFTGVGDDDELRWEGESNYRSGGTGTGLLLDLDNGTLTVYQNRQRIGVLINGLSGVYSWMVFTVDDTEFSIERGPVPS